MIRILLALALVLFGIHASYAQAAPPASTFVLADSAAVRLIAPAELRELDHSLAQLLFSPAAKVWSIKTPGFTFPA